MTQIHARVASAVLATAVVFPTVVLAAPASAAPHQPEHSYAPAVGCTDPAPPDRDWRTGDFRAAANIRTGPSTSCTPVGGGYPGQGADYYCYVWGEGGTWTYLRDISTGKSGWVFDELLTGNGSLVHC